VVIEHDPEDQPERLGREISRQIQKVYGVRSAELTSHTKVEE
jgi:hypothetical protein